MSAERLLRLLSLLTVRRNWGGAELAQRLGVTPRTIRRDVDRLRELGYQVSALPGPAGGYELGAGSGLPPLLLDDDAAVVPLHGSRAGIAGVRPDTLALLALACRDAERLRFGYVDSQGRPTKRQVEPYRLVSTARHWYLVARDIDRGDWRSFRLDRLADPAPTGQRSSPADPPDAARFVAEAIASGAYRYQARFLIGAPAGVVADRIPGYAAVIEAVDDQRCLLISGSDHLEAIVIHLALLDLPFTALEPPELRQRCAELSLRLGEAATTTLPEDTGYGPG